MAVELLFFIICGHGFPGKVVFTNPVRYGVLDCLGGSARGFPFLDRRGLGLGWILGLGHPREYPEVVTQDGPAARFASRFDAFFPQGMVQDDVFKDGDSCFGAAASFHAFSVAGLL